MKNIKLVVDNDGYYYKGPKLEIDIQCFYFTLIGDQDAPRLVIYLEYPDDIKTFFDENQNYEPLIYTSKVFRNSVIQYFISCGIPEYIANNFDYSEQGLQGADQNIQVIDFDIDEALILELESKNVLIDCDCDED